MIDIFYSYIFIQAAMLAVKIIKLFNPKIKAREDKCEALLSKYSKVSNQSQGTRYWFHSASMGEFEQAKPIIEKLKSTEPNCFIFVTFYSPSGYENQKSYKYADAIAYMPIDSKHNARRLINIIKPDKAIFIRYEIWLNHLLELKKQNIPTYLVNASKPGSEYLNFYYRKAFNLFDKIFVMNDSEIKYFTKVVRHNFVRILPDTRFDRIMERVNANKNNPLFDKRIFGNNLVLVAGSSWGADENLIITAVNRINSESGRKISLIIVPHEPTPEHLKILSEKCSDFVLLSEFEINPSKYSEAIANKQTAIIVDSIGKLLRIYANANIAYIGGAFGVGIHSVTEPAGYALPLSCGPKMQNSPDAVELEKIGVLNIVKNDNELYTWLKKIISDKAYYNKLAKESGDYVRSRVGATDKFISEL